MKRGWGAGVALVAAAGALHASCRDLVAPEPIDLYAALCQSYVDCAAAGEVPDSFRCPDAFYAQIGRSGDEQALTDFDVSAVGTAIERDCLAGCAGLGRCLAEPPFCVALGRPCSEDRACCAGGAGVSACSTDGVCCVVDGGPCGAGLPCCSGEACAANQRCGGVVCGLKDAACDDDFDCCSLSCIAGLCAVRSCAEIGQQCLIDDDCCPDGDDKPLSCLGGVCGSLGCEACDPADPDNCCVAQGLTCYASAGGVSQCGPIGCVIEGVECGDDSDCACESGPALVCDDGFSPHCATCRGPGSTCPAGSLCCDDVPCDESHHCPSPPT